MSIFHDKRSAAWLSVCTNGTLMVMKLAVGMISGSLSIFSEACHSAVDLLAAVIALFAVRISDKPSDDDHPFGHGKIENISGIFEAILIFFAAGLIIYESVNKLIYPKPIEFLGLGIAMMLISTAANGILTKIVMDVGKKPHRSRL